MQLCYFSNNSCLWKPCNISAQNFILYSKYVFLSSVVIVTTGSDGAKTFLPSVFHVQSGPHIQDFQKSCFVNSCYSPKEVIAMVWAKEEKRRVVLFSFVLLWQELNCGTLFFTGTESASKKYCSLFLNHYIFR